MLFSRGPRRPMEVIVEAFDVQRYKIKRQVECGR